MLRKRSFLLVFLALLLVVTPVLSSVSAEEVDLNGDTEEGIEDIGGSEDGEENDEEATDSDDEEANEEEITESDDEEGNAESATEPAPEDDEEENVEDANGNDEGAVQDEEENNADEMFSLLSSGNPLENDIEHTNYRVDGDSLNIYIEWEEDHGFDKYCYERNPLTSCGDTGFSVEIGGKVINDVNMVTPIILEEDYLSLTVDLSDSNVDTSQAIKVHYESKGIKGLPDDSFTVEVGYEFDITKDVKSSYFYVENDQLKIDIAWYGNHGHDFACSNCGYSGFSVTIGNNTVTEFAEVYLSSDFLYLTLENIDLSSFSACGQAPTVEVSFDPDNADSSADLPEKPFTFSVNPLTLSESNVSDLEIDYDVSISINGEEHDYGDYLYELYGTIGEGGLGDKIEALEFVEADDFKQFKDIISRVDENGEKNVNLSIAPVLTVNGNSITCIPEELEINVELQLDVENYYSEQSADLLKDQLTFKETDSEKLAFSINSQNWELPQTISLTTVDDAFAEGFMVGLVDFNVTETITYDGEEVEKDSFKLFEDRYDGLPFPVVIEDNDELVKVTSNYSAIVPSRVQNYTFSLNQVHPDFISPGEVIYVLVTAAGKGVQLVDPAYQDGDDPKRKTTDFILYKIDAGQWNSKHSFYVYGDQVTNPNNLHFITWKDNGNAAQSLNFGTNNYISGDFSQFEDDGSIEDFLKNTVQMHIVDQWLYSSQYVDAFAKEWAAADSDFKAFINHYNQPDLDSLVETDISTLIEDQARDKITAGPYVGIKQSKLIRVADPGNEEDPPIVVEFTPVKEAISPCVDPVSPVIIENVSINKAGYIYLAPKNANITSKDDLDQLVAGGLAVHYGEEETPELVDAYENVDMSIEGLTVPGTYVFYGVDNTMNHLISEPSADAFTVAYPVTQTVGDLQITSTSVTATTTLAKSAGCSDVQAFPDNSYVVFTLMQGDKPVAVQEIEIEVDNSRTSSVA